MFIHFFVLLYHISFAFFIVNKSHLMTKTNCVLVIFPYFPTLSVALILKKRVTNLKVTQTGVNSWELFSATD